jgi:hypothetical protein
MIVQKLAAAAGADAASAGFTLAGTGPAPAAGTLRTVPQAWHFTAWPAYSSFTWMALPQFALGHSSRIDIARSSHVFGETLIGHGHGAAGPDAGDSPQGFCLFPVLGEPSRKS